MAKKTFFDWINSPIVVVPAAAAVFGLVMVPFAVANTDHAAQFYGALVAAFVAAGAVVGGAFYQAELTRQRDNRFAERETLIDAIELFGFLDYYLRRTRILKNQFSSLRFEIEVGANAAETDFTALTYGDLQKYVISTDVEGWRENLAKASRLPGDMARKLILSIYGLAHVYHTALSIKVEAETDFPTRRDVNRWIDRTTELISNLESSCKMIEDFLKVNKAWTEPP